MPRAQDSLPTLIARLRHDVVKHLDIPPPDATLSRAAWEVLARRLYSDHTGLVPMGRHWLRRLRRVVADPQLELALDGLAASIDVVAGLRDAVAAGREAMAPTDAALVDALRRCVAAVALIESAASGDLVGDLGGDDALDDDAEAALGFVLDPAPAPRARRGKRAAPPLPEAPDAGQRCRVLVVDDRLQAIERFQAIEHLRDRFEWVTLCELPGPCWVCPHRDDCGMKRARTFRELEGALRRAQVSGRPVDVLLMDVRFDDIAAGEVLPTPPGHAPASLEVARALQGPLMVRALRQRADLPTLPVVLMTTRRGLPSGAERLLEGLDGLHFVDDEASLEALTARLDAVARRRRRPVTDGGFFWGHSTAMQAVREQIELLAMGPRPVLLTGPSGAGKSFLVEEVMLPLSGRGQLITLDLSALPETLVESELFGHVKGAFSGAVSDRPGLIEEADGGVLFIDEIGHLTPENQRKLLLFLQDRKVRRVGASHRTSRHVDVKVVVATHMDLSEEVERGHFRFDLYMRLRPATQVRLPAIAERPEDLDGLMAHLVDKLASGPELEPLVRDVAQARRRPPHLALQLGPGATPDAGLALRMPEPTVNAMRAYPWPGNTRELESVLDTLLLRALADARLVTTHSPILEVDHYMALKLLGMGRPRAPSTRPTLNLPIEPAADLKQMRQRLERAYLVEAFRAGSGDMERVTELVLGSDHPDDRHRLTVRMNQLGLKVTELKLSVQTP